MMMTVAARLLLNPADDLLKLRDDRLRHWHYTVKTGKGRKMRSLGQRSSRANGIVLLRTPHWASFDHLVGDKRYWLVSHAPGHFSSKPDRCLNRARILADCRRSCGATATCSLSRAATISQVLTG